MAGLSPDDPLNFANTIFDQGQTSLITSLAGPFHAFVVDINTPFRGHENELTFVASGGAHPTPEGYAVIAQQMVLTVAPEPSSLALLAIGLGSLAILTRHKRRRAISMVGGTD